MKTQFGLLSDFKEMEKTIERARVKQFFKNRCSNFMVGLAKRDRKY